MINMNIGGGLTLSKTFSIPEEPSESLFRLTSKDYHEDYQPDLKRYLSSSNTPNGGAPFKF